MPYIYCFMKYFIFICVCFGLTLIPVYSGLAYAPLTTHSGLTENIANFYNFSAPKKITDTQMEWLIQGSQNEDNGLRCLNHAYDPIYNRGWHLSLINTDIGYTSKEWSQSENAQIAFGAMDFSAIRDTWQSLWLGPNNLDSNQTWNKAIYEYLSGHEKEAFVALGHVLHLIEDATVPAHVRANSHPDILGKYSWSDYEQRAKIYDRAILKNYATALKKQGLTSSKFDSLNSLFDDLASKVNHYYYSDDTIRSSEYKYPQPEYEGELPEGYFVMGQDYNGKTIHLAYKQSGVGYRVKSGLDVYTLNNDIVFKDYWQSLSPLAVSYGSSAIDLFFKEVQKAAQEKDYLAQNNQSALTKLAANLLNLTVNLNSGPTNTPVSTYPSNSSATPETSLTTLKATTSTTKTKITATTKTVVSTATTRPTTTTTKKTTTTTTTTKPTTTTTTKLKLASCSFSSTNFNASQTVILNEIAWMGSAHSANDEWIELKNLTNQNVNIGQWQIISKTGNINIILPSNTIIPAHGFYLLERTDETSAPYTSSDFIYSGSLNNSNDGLKLFASQCSLMDTVLADSTWPAGDVSSKRSMERGSDLTWHTYSYATSLNDVFGTPKVENSPSGWVPPSNTNNGTSNNPPATTTTASTATTIPTQETTTTTVPVCSSNILENNPQVIFNEIAWMGSAHSVNDEWIELKNISDNSVDISSWQILDKTGNIKIIIPTGTTLPAHQLWLLERTNDDSVPEVAADLIYTGALNNENEILSFYDAGCRLMDQAKADPNWLAGNRESFKTMERGSDLTWHTYCGESGYGSPREENSLNCSAPVNTTTTTTTMPINNEPGDNLYPSLEWNWHTPTEKKAYLKVKKSELLTPVNNQEIKAVVFYLNQDPPSGDKYDYVSWSQPSEWGVRQGDNQKALLLIYSGPYSVTSSSVLLLAKPEASQSNPNNSRNYQDYYQENIWVETYGYIDDFGSHGFGEQPLTNHDYITVATYGLADEGTHLKLLKADNYRHYFKDSYFEVPSMDAQSLSLNYDSTTSGIRIKFKPAMDHNVSPQSVQYGVFLDSQEGREMSSYCNWGRYFQINDSETGLRLDADGYYNIFLKNSEFDTGDNRFKDTIFYGAIAATDELGFQGVKLSLGNITVPKLIPDQQPLSDYIQNVQLHFQTNPAESGTGQYLFLDFDVVKQPEYPSTNTNFFLTFKWHSLNNSSIGGLLSIPWETFCPPGQYCGGEISYGSRGIPFENKHYSILLTNISNNSQPGSYNFQNNDGLTPDNLKSLGIADLSQIKLDMSYEVASSYGNWYFITPKLN